MAIASRLRPDPPFALTVDPDSAERAWRAIAPQIDRILDTFYRDIMRSSLAALLPADSLERLKERHRDHWRAVFVGEVDGEMLRRMKRMHIAHRETGLPGTTYLTAHLFLLARFHDAALDAATDLDDARRMVRAIDTMVGADILNALTTYYDTMIVD